MASGDVAANGAGDTTNNGANSGESHGADVRGADLRGSDARGSDARGSDAIRAGSGSGTGGASGKHKVYESNVRKAILAVPLNPLPGSLADYREQLTKTVGEGNDKSRLLYSSPSRGA